MFSWAAWLHTPGWSRERNVSKLWCCEIRGRRHKTSMRTEEALCNLLTWRNPVLFSLMRILGYQSSPVTYGDFNQCFCVLLAVYHEDVRCKGAVQSIGRLYYVIRLIFEDISLISRHQRWNDNTVPSHCCISVICHKGETRSFDLIVMKMGHGELQYVAQTKQRSRRGRNCAYWWRKMVATNGKLPNVEQEQPSLMQGQSYMKKEQSSPDASAKISMNPRLKYRVTDKNTTLLNYFVRSQNESRIF